jgi:HlyD family secretion protein
MPSDPAPHTRPDPGVLSSLGLDKPRAARFRVVIQLLVVAGLLGAGAFGVKRYMGARADAQKPVFRTVQASRTNVQVTISATGTLQGLNTVEVGSEVSGKLVSVKVDYNDSVKAGQVLAEIDPEQLRAAVEQESAQVASADAAIHQARATLTEAKQKSARAESQLKSGLLSEQDFEATQAATARAEASLNSANASATLARASLKSAKSKLLKTTIVSPIDGIVLARAVEAGQTVTAGFQTPVLFKITQDLRRMTLRVYVDEADIGRAREGQAATFTVDAYPNKVFPSKVLSLRNEPKTDQSVVTYEAVLEVDNSELLLRPGMTATATITAEVHDDVLVVPNAALRFTLPANEQQGFSFGPGRRKPGQSSPEQGKRLWSLRGAEPVSLKVQTGASDGQFTEVVGGDVKVGTEVIVDMEEKK